MKTFEVIRANTGAVIQTFEADYYKEVWDFHFYINRKHWWQPAVEVGRFPYYKNIVIKEKQ